MPQDSVRALVGQIIRDVEERGNEALLEMALRYDGAVLSSEGLRVGEGEFAAAEAEVSEETKEAVRRSLQNIHAFAGKSLRKDWTAKNFEGAEVGERFVPFDRVGVYVPGGKAPLVSTALMTAGFAQAAGVKEIVAATPCGQDGKVNPALLYAMRQAGVTEAVKVGGAQAIAALAIGTETIAPVERIFGPGNQFVVEAKRQLVGYVSIDLLPGPSEILILADRSANPAYIAADMLAQAEHGGDSAVVLLSDSKEMIEMVKEEVGKQLKELGRADIVGEVLEGGTFLVEVDGMEQGVKLVNDYAPEHLSLVVEDEERISALVKTAGAIYLGQNSPVAVGDFLAGPSHTLPTGGGGRSFSGLRADQFQRRTSIVRMEKESVRKSLAVVEEFARIEGLDAHGKSVSIRLDGR